MKKYWFRSRRLGYGFFPISFEGWLATFGLFSLILLSAWLNDIWDKNTDSKAGFRFVFDTIVLACVFTALYKDKVEGGMRWRFWK